LIFIRGKFFDKISKLSNYGLIIAGIFLLIYQLNGFFTADEDYIQSPKIDVKHHHDH